MLDVKQLYEESDFQVRNEVSLKVSPLVLTTNSIIENFPYIRDYEPQTYVIADAVNREHRASRKAKGLVPDGSKKTLLDFDDLGNVVSAFREWRQGYRDNPMFAHCKDKDSKDIFFELLNRFDNPDRNIVPLSKALESFDGQGVFLTLTYSHDVSLRHAWDNVSKDWHKFMARLRIELGLKKGQKLHYIRVLEAQGNGYPHIHVLFLGVDYLFYAGNKKAWLGDNPHSKNLKHFWGRGSVFVNKTAQGQGVVNPVRYLMKYIRKTFSGDPEDNKAELTQAFMWAFNKRSWDTSRGLMTFLGAVPVVKGRVSLVGIVKFTLPFKQKFKRLFCGHKTKPKPVSVPKPVISAFELESIKRGLKLKALFSKSHLSNFTIDPPFERGVRGVSCG